MTENQTQISDAELKAWERIASVHKILTSPYMVAWLRKRNKQPHDGCDGCKYIDYEFNDEPCKWCRYNYEDKYERRENETINNNSRL